MITAKQLIDFLLQYPPDWPVTIDIRDWDDEIFYSDECHCILSR